MKKSYLYLVCALFSLVSFTVLAETCGLKGNIEERIKSCRQSFGVDGEFQLVARTSEGYEIFRGKRTGVIWSSDLREGEVNFLQNKVSKICEPKRPEFAGIEGNWILPPVQRYLQALKYGIQEGGIPGISDKNYWTSTSHRFYVNSRYIFEGNREYKVDKKGNYVVRHLEIDMGYANVKCILEPVF